MSGRLAKATILLSLTLVACGPSSSTPPTRQFTTEELLINGGALSPGWSIISAPSDERCTLYDFQHCVEVSTLRVGRGPATRVDHIVARFETAQDAARAFQQRSFAHDTSGPSAATWFPLEGVTYASKVPDQLRIVCATIEGIPSQFALCLVEARYEEFFSVLLYNGPSREAAIGELEELARSVDNGMHDHIGD